MGRKKSWYTLEDYMRAYALINKRFDDIKKWGKIITEVEEVGGKKPKTTYEARRKIEFTLNAKEDIENILEETWDKWLSKYSRKVISEELVRSNDELIILWEKKIEEIIDTFLKKIEREMKTYKQMVQNMKNSPIPEEEKRKIISCCNTAIDQEEVSNISNGFSIEKVYKEIAKDLIFEIRKLKTDINNFTYTCRQRVNEIAMGLLNLDDESPLQAKKQREGTLLVTALIHKIENIGLFYEREMKI